MTHFKIDFKNTAIEVDHILDPIKHSPCTYEGCGRKSVMRFVSDGTYSAACKDHEHILMEQVQRLQNQGSDVWFRTSQ